MLEKFGDTAELINLDEESGAHPNEHIPVGGDLSLPFSWGELLNILSEETGECMRYFVAVCPHKKSRKTVSLITVEVNWGYAIPQMVYCLKPDRGKNG
ncbi:MAG: hypothetical protein WCX97_00775 [Candidatus Magasanikbacteria bacterium]